MKTSRDRYFGLPLLVMIATVLVVVGGLTGFLWSLSRAEAYRMLSQEGEHLAESIGEGTIHGLQRVHTAQDALISRLRLLSAWIDTTLTDDVHENQFMLDDITRREKLEGIIVLNKRLEPTASSFSAQGLLMERFRRISPPHHHRGGEPPWFPAIRHLMNFLDSGREFEVFDPWRWRHRTADAVGFAFRRENGGVIFIRASRDLMEQTLDTESFSNLLRNLTLSSRIVKIALVDTSNTIVLASHPEIIGHSWPMESVGGDPAREKVMWIEKSFSVSSGEKGLLCLALSTVDIHRQLDATKRNLMILAITAFTIGMAGVLVTQAMQRSHQRRIHEMEQELDRQERFADIGRMSAGVAHEIRNPLNAVALTVQRIVKEVEKPEPNTDRVRDLSHVIRAEMNRMDMTIRQMGALAHSLDISFESVDITTVTRQVIELYRAEAEEHSVDLRSDLPAVSILVSGNDSLLRQAIGNLILNAIQASPEKGSVYIGVHLTDSTVRIRVQDQGTGFTDTDLERAQEPFYTTKTRGLGIGLALARRIIDEHGGRLTWGNHDHRGAVVEIVLNVPGKDSE